MTAAASLLALPRGWRLQGPPTFRHAVIIALVLHGLLLLGLGFNTGFSFSQAVNAPQPYLDVTLTQRPSAEAPTDAEALAQFDQQGSGAGAPLTQSITRDVKSAADTRSEPSGAAAIQEEFAAQTVALEVLSVHTQNSATPPQSADDFAADNTAATTGAERAALRAQLQQAQRLYSRMPRTLRTTALSAQAASHASYLTDWVSRIEAVGNQYYPAEARRQQLYGELQLAVTLLPNGDIADIEVLRSSGHAILDQAAQETLRRAAPFAPFPPDMAAEWDRFEILRTWQFIPGHAVNTLP